jgi:hypothetical protein
MSETKSHSTAFEGWLLQLAENSFFWAITSFLVGFAARWLAIKLGGSEGQQLSFLIGLVGAVATLQIGNLYRHREISDQLQTLKGALTEHTTKLERHLVLKESVAFLEPAITDERFLETLSQITNAYEEVQNLKQEHPNCVGFFEWKENAIFNSMVPKLQELAQRHIVIDKEAKELTTNRDFLRKLPQHEVRAVSYQDDGFWDEPEGKDFLEAHTIMLAKRVSISRIFILTEEEVVSQRSVVETQIQMGISVRIILAGKLNDWEREDFVLYDDTYVRFAKLYESTGTNTLKHATLIIGTDKVRDFIERYESLYARSVNATDFYTLLDMGETRGLNPFDESRQI